MNSNFTCLICYNEYKIVSRIKMKMCRFNLDAEAFGNKIHKSLKLRSPLIQYYSQKSIQQLQNPI